MFLLGEHDVWKCGKVTHRSAQLNSGQPVHGKNNELNLLISTCDVCGTVSNLHRLIPTNNFLHKIK